MSDRHHRYNVSEKGRARNRRVEASRVRVQIAGQTYSYRVPREKRDELAGRISAFRERQREEYRDARIG